MSITKKLLPLSMVASLLLFTACGGGSDNSTPKENNSPTTKAVTVPQKISIDIPDALKNKRIANSTIGKLALDDSQKDEHAQSFGYQQLTSTISQAERTVKDVKGNMEYLTLMMPDIVKKCSDSTENETCTIPSGEIKLTVEGQTLSMGEILYTQQDDSQKYQQVVVLDLKPTLEAMGATLEKDLETVKWSTDENHIETISDFKDSNSSFNMHLIYDKESSGASSMTITDQYDFDDMKGNFILKLNDKNDVNNTVLVETTSTFNFENENNSFSSKGIVDDNGGYLISRGSYLSDEFAEKETFDAHGSLLKSTFCNSEDTCDMNEPDTWKNFDYEDGFVDSFNDDDSFIDELPDYQEPLELTFTNIEHFPTYTYCEILPLNYSGALTEDDVYKNSIGSFARFDDDLFGVLFDVDEKDNINTLPIACANNESSDFFLIPETIKPTLAIKE